MASLAGLFKSAGYRVTGSDIGCYPPMSTMLEQLGIAVMRGFRQEHLVPKPDLVVIGNVCTRENPEARAAMEKGIPYHSMPDAVAQFFCRDRFSIVLAGTHGKTTSASLTSWLLEYAGRHPSFLIGGVPLNFGTSFRLAGGKEIVIEGDEYDTAFFDKTPKLLHYPIQAGVLGNVEFDHADIYADLDAVMAAFRSFVSQIPSDATLLAWIDSDNVRTLLRDASCRVITFSVSDAPADMQAHSVTMGPEGTDFTLHDAIGDARYHSPLHGMHNLQNVVGILGLLKSLRVPDATLQEGLRQFAGVKRRQEVVASEYGITVIDDFAHHPTAVRETLRGLQAQYPLARIHVAFEPRSNTSGRRIFFDSYLEAFAGMTSVCIAPVQKWERIPVDERLDTQGLAATLTQRGTEATAATNTEAIAQWLTDHARTGDLIVIMSNGAFDQLHQRVAQILTRRP